MRRASGALALVAALSLATAAIAGDAVLEGEGEGAAAPTGASIPLPPPTGDARDGVRAGLAAQLAVVRKTEASVAAKRDDATAARAARVRAAYQVLRPRTELGGTTDAWLASARRRAASRYLLARAQREERLLADETARLTDATARVSAELEAALALAAPTSAGLRWPVQGEPQIAAGPGPWQHAASGATLARRGVELTVPRHAPALAAGAGTVRYAGPIRGLGLGVIIDHGSVWTVVARLGAVAVRRGEQVAARAPLGTAAERTLAVEVRLPLGPGGTPVPPASFLTR